MDGKDRPGNILCKTRQKKIIKILEKKKRNKLIGKSLKPMQLCIFSGLHLVYGGIYTG